MSFIRNLTLPIITIIISYAETPEQMIDSIDKGYEQGAEAFCLQLERLPRKYRTFENIKEFIRHCRGKPVYCSCYRWNNPETEQTDEQIVEDLMIALKAGADLVDIPTDLFNRSQHEVSFDKEMIEKQKVVIRQIHEMGKEVIMASHLRCYYSPEDTLKLLLSQQERGVDIVKAVGEAYSEEQSEEAFYTDRLIAKNIHKPYLYLIGSPGSEYCYKHRRQGPFIGSFVFLCTINEVDTFQPKIREAIELKNKFLAEKSC